jgi:hypothetical protein
MTDKDTRTIEEKAAEWAVQGKLRHDLEAGYRAMSSVGEDADDKVNLRVNSGLKAEFGKVCKHHHTSISRELKRFMTEVVKTQRIP